MLALRVCAGATDDWKDLWPSCLSPWPLPPPAPWPLPPPSPWPLPPPGRSLPQDVVVRRAFNGDEKRYEAAVSDDGALMVAIDTTCDEEVRLTCHPYKLYHTPHVTHITHIHPSPLVDLKVRLYLDPYLGPAYAPI